MMFVDGFADDGWETVGKKNKGSQNSAFLGEYHRPAAASQGSAWPAAAAPAAQPAAPAAPAAAPAPAPGPAPRSLPHL